MIDALNKTCKCGCGRSVVRPKANYLKGHGRKGRKNSLAHNAAISKANKGKCHCAGWNKGLVGVYKCSDTTKQKISKVAKERGIGKWMKGRKLSESTKKKLLESLIGHVVSDDTRKKIGEANGGANNGMYGQKHTEEVKATIAKATKDQWKRPEFVKRHLEYQSSPEWKEIARQCAAKAAQKKELTTIEIKVHDLLGELGVVHRQGYIINDIEHKYACDIFVPNSRLVIECDGDYWHDFPHGRAIDHIRNEELISKGYKILRLWERDIRKMTKDQLLVRMVDAIHKD